MMLRGAVLVAGTSSDAGKSLLVAGLCRAFARRGISVAPFKAQNMSNNSVVTADGEIGRAQYMQAQAAGITPTARLNPVLLKPGDDRRSQLVVHGQAVGTVGARDYHRDRAELAAIVAADLAALRNDYDVVIVEGAGSPAEINLRDTDLANMGLATAADLPVIVVGDIDRGGVLAHLLGTVAALDAADQQRVKAFVVNKFRGDPEILAPGLRQLQERTGRPTLGVLPYEPGLWLDAEDSLAAGTGAIGPPDPTPTQLTVAAIRLPRVSNSTDVEALACEPGVAVRWTTRPADVLAADLVVLPGTKATVSDLAWLREQGLAAALTARRGPIVAICGGFQMLARTITDTVESGVGTVPGLGLGAMDIRFDPTKTVRDATGTAWGIPVRGYEIHHGVVAASDEPPLLHDSALGPEGIQRDTIYGTHWHGLLGNDEFRGELLRRVAAQRGGDFTPTTGISYEGQRAAQWDLMADLVTTHLDMSALERIIGGDGPAVPTLRLLRD